jgi:hypothetical protein
VVVGVALSRISAFSINTENAHASVQSSFRFGYPRYAVPRMVEACAGMTFIINPAWPAVAQVPDENGTPV